MLRPLQATRSFFALQAKVSAVFPIERGCRLREGRRRANGAAMQPRLGRMGATALTTLALIVLGASSVDASAAVADASAGGSEVLARLKTLVKPMEAAVVRDLELAAPVPQPMPEVAPMPAAKEHPRVEKLESLPQAGLPNAEDHDPNLSLIHI